MKMKGQQNIWFEIAKYILLIFALLVCFVMHELSTDHRTYIDFDKLTLLEGFKQMFIRWLNCE